MKRKEIKNEESDNLAAMGIGAMIVFIALILVAAVASAVIIQTAEKLQQNAQTTGDQTEQQMASKIMPLSAVIEATAPANTLRVTFELAPGSQSVTPANAVWNVVCAAGTDAGNFAGFAAVSTTASATIDPGEIYEVSLTLATCTFAPNTAHYLMFQAGNSGFTYEVLNYGSSTAVGAVVI